MTDLAASQQFDIGRAIQRTFATLRRNFVTYLVLAVPLVVLPRVAWTIAQVAIREFDQNALATFQPTMPLMAQLSINALTVFVTLVGANLLQAAVIHGVIADLNGRHVSLRDCLRAGLQRFASLVGLSVAVAILCLLGFVVIVVPGLIMMTAWVVSTPALVVEDRASSRACLAVPT